MKPKIHICTFNVYTYVVEDTIKILKDSLKDDFEISVSKELKVNVTNIIFENFNLYSVNKIKQIKKKNNFKIIVVLSEHMNLDSNKRLVLNNIIWNHKRSYLINLYDRFLFLTSIINLIDCFIVLYDIPIISNLKKIFPNTKIFSIGYNYSFENNLSKKKYDFCFIGTITASREIILNKLSKKFCVYFKKNMSMNVKENIFNKSKYSLNIPQEEKWSFISPVRIFSSLRKKLRTINILYSDYHVKSPFSNTLNLKLDELLKLSIIDINKLFDKLDVKNYFKNDSNKLKNHLIKPRKNKLNGLVVRYNDSSIMIGKNDLLVYKSLNKCMPFDSFNVLKMSVETRVKSKYFIFLFMFFDFLKYFFIGLFIKKDLNPRFIRTLFEKNI